MQSPEDEREGPDVLIGAFQKIDLSIADLSLAKQLEAIGTFGQNFIVHILRCLCRLEGAGQWLGVDSITRG